MHMEVAQTDSVDRKWGLKNLADKFLRRRFLPNAWNEEKEREREKGAALQIPLVSALLEWRLAAAAKKEGTLARSPFNSDKNQAMRMRWSMFLFLPSVGRSLWLTGFQVCGWLSSFSFLCLHLEARACLPAM